MIMNILKQHFLTKTVKKALRSVKDYIVDRGALRYLKEHSAEVCSIEEFDVGVFRERARSFLRSMQLDGNAVKYRYSNSCAKPTLYASVYACMTYSMLGILKKLNAGEKQEWIQYFDSFQNPEDGLFYDSAVENEIFADSDWWGARHLALHMISAYTDLNSKPRYQFKFLSPYYDSNYMTAWINEFDWDCDSILDTDVDNKIMNIGGLLQYQRDQWNDGVAASALTCLKELLLAKLNGETGMWGGGDVNDPVQRSRIVQFAYHLFALFFYDSYVDFSHERIVKTVLATQNKVGGYGVRLNSSACEDIDSIDILLRFSPYVSEKTKDDIETSISRAFTWILQNQVDDGGFVFRLNESMEYGHHELMGQVNCGAMFPSWFRVLSIARIIGRGDDRFIINNAPGLVFI